MTESPSKSCVTCGNPVPPGAIEPLCASCLGTVVVQDCARLPDKMTIAGGDETVRISPPVSGTHHPTQLPEIEGLRLLSELGRGGMGVVWLAEQTMTSRRVAVKFIRGFLDDGGDTMRARFAREIELAARLDHPNIARVYDGGQAGGAPYSVMEYIEGQPVTSHVRDNRLDRPAILEIMRGICEGIEHAHRRGVLHRDLKPSNILVNVEGVPKILDFGLARALDNQSVMLTIEGAVAGTPAYMSPEQARGETALIDTRSDLYSLGVVFYELLTGHRPYSVDGPLERVLGVVSRAEVARPRNYDPGMAADLEMFLLHSLAPQPADRYASAGEMAEDLRRFLAGEPLLAGRTSTAYFVRKWIVRNRTAVAAGIAALAAGAGAVAYHWWTLGHEKAAALSAEAEARESLHRFLGSSITENMQRGDYVRALQFIDEAIRAGHPAGGELLFRRLEALQALDDPAADSLITSMDISGLEPENQARLAFWKADRMLASSAHDEATQLVKQAVDMGLPPVEDALARATLSATVSEAIKHYENAAALAPWRAVCQENLVLALLLSGRVEDARARIRLCRLIFPANPIYDVYEGTLEAVQGNPEKARTILERIPKDAQCAPLGRFVHSIAEPLANAAHDLVGAQYGLAGSDLKSGLADALAFARAYHDYAGRSGANFSATPLGHADAFRLIFDFLGPSNSSPGIDVRSMPKGSKVNSTLIIEAITGYGRVVRKSVTGDREGSIRDLREALQVNHEGTLWLLLASMEFNAGRPEQGLQAALNAQTVPALLPGVAQAGRQVEAMLASHLYRSTKETAHLERARAAYRSAYNDGIRIAPNHVSHESALTIALAAGDWLLAHEVLDCQPPDTLKFWKFSAQVHYARGSQEQALKAAEEAVRRFPDDADARVLAVKIRERQLEQPSPREGSAPVPVNLLIEGTAETVVCAVAPDGTSMIAGIAGANLTLGMWSHGQPVQDHDRMLLVSDTILDSPATNQHWAKAGMSAIPAAKPLMGAESIGPYVGWQQVPENIAATASKTRTASGQLKGSIDLNHAFSGTPGTLYLAALVYETTNGGGIAGQCPPGNGDDNVDPAEFLAVPVPSRGRNHNPAAPPDPMMTFRVSQATTADPVTLVLEWQTNSPGQVEYSEDFLEWKVAPGVQQASGSATASLSIDLSKSATVRRLYRLRVLP